MGLQADFELTDRRRHQRQREHRPRRARRHSVDRHDAVRADFIDLPIRHGDIDGKDLGAADRVAQPGLQADLIAIDQDDVFRLDADPRFSRHQAGHQRRRLRKVLESRGHVLPAQGIRQLIDLADSPAGAPQDLPVAGHADRNRSPLAGRFRELEAGKFQPVVAAGRWAAMLVWSAARLVARRTSTGPTVRLANCTSTNRCRPGPEGPAAGVNRGQGIAAGVAGHQLGIRRQTNAESIKGLAITADREGGLGLDAAAVQLGRDIAKGLQGRRLAGRSVGRMPTQFEIAVQADTVRSVSLLSPPGVCSVAPSETLATALA